MGPERNPKKRRQTYMNQISFLFRHPDQVAHRLTTLEPIRRFQRCQCILEIETAKDHQHYVWSITLSARSERMEVRELLRDQSMDLNYKSNPEQYQYGQENLYHHAETVRVVGNNRTDEELLHPEENTL
ncbi:hypothetical protein Glove_140g34 [Diversispora epigaea]|uniref:Uncharacterized protein n=1 Tax=Diversispora epigaea TaxID=1348612 RepID=A0A397IV96_9GLOM|nr:hypothetical protein Glove_140g34 [Diversispora epigaea]